MGSFNYIAQRSNLAVHIGILQERSKDALVERETRLRHHLDIQAQWFSSPTENFDSLRKTPVADEKYISRILLSGTNSMKQHQCLGRCRGLVQ